MIAIDSKLPQVGTTIFTVMSGLAAREGAINLSQGFPDYDPPLGLVQALNTALADGRHQYAPMTGVLPLREQLARVQGARYQCELCPEANITIVPGATEALYCAITALVHPGDEVVVLDPAYDSYAPAIALCGAKAVHVPLSESEGFGIDWQRLKDAIGPKTRMLITNTPHNPTGGLITQSDLDQLAELLRGTNICVLSDEVYEYLVFDGEAHASVLAHEELRERSVAVFSFGKTFHATGWKTGFFIAPEYLTKEVRKVHQYVTFVANTAVQYALADFYAQDQAHLSGLTDFYQQKRDFFCEGLQRTKFKFTPSRGTFFQLVDYSELSDLDDMAFCQALTKAGVAAIPLSPFYKEPPQGQRLARFCFAKGDETLAKALEVLSGLKEVVAT